MMKPYHTIPLIFFTLFFYSCKKEKKANVNPNITYRVIDQTVKAADVDPIKLDINQDGTVDYIFFAVYSVNDQGVNLNVGANPIDGNLAKMSRPDDTKFQNMGSLAAQNMGTTIDQTLAENQIWSDDAAYLTIRTESAQGHKSYLGNWAHETPVFMALQIRSNGQVFFGWAKLKFNRNTEILTLIDCAYHRTPGTKIKAGER